MISEMLDANPFVLRLLVSSDSIEEARSKMWSYLSECEESVRRVECPLHPLEIKNTIDCIRVFRNIISPASEKKTGHSCLKTIWMIATDHWRKKDWPDVSDSFTMEMKHLFKGIIGLSGIYSKSGICRREVPAFVNLEGKDAAIVRSNLLNEKVHQYKDFTARNRYSTGLESEVLKRREENKKKILAALGATEKDWHDAKWHMKNVFQDIEQIKKIVGLSTEEKETIKKAKGSGLAFAVTPFYLSMFDSQSEAYGLDWPLRKQVIPNREYLEGIAGVGLDNLEALDFMKENDTSPVGFVTRRYPMIAIFKPYNTCPQMCVYCQRDWELLGKAGKQGAIPSKAMEEALSWFRGNHEVEEVLITGGDPLVMSNKKIEELLNAFGEMKHIKRIRFGTRLLVTMPMRFDEQLVGLLQKFHQPPARVISIVTHVQSAYEISPEMAQAVKRIKSAGMDIFNQQVYTIQNCRRFETCFLRENLRQIGIMPYYLFNLKGKEETSFFKVPIARMLQEQKEEARLMPGLVRTDKPVFNIPTLGKNDLGSWQDHDLIMIMSDGSRIYEFYPWEKYMAPVKTYIYKDMPIFDFLKRLETLGENIDDYKTIWYYF
jgi:lysine 2,3-aminomutase